MLYSDWAYTPPETPLIREWRSPLLSARLSKSQESELGMGRYGMLAQGAQSLTEHGAYHLSAQAAASQESCPNKWPCGR